MSMHLKANTRGLLDYVKAGNEAVKKVRKSMYRLMNLGRTTARRLISAQFTPRTGFLRRAAGKMRAVVSIKSAEIKGQVKPIPRLMNIFESGATLAEGRGFLRPRPVVTPAQETMESAAFAEFNQILHEVGK